MLEIQTAMCLAALQAMATDTRPHIDRFVHREYVQQQIDAVLRACKSGGDPWWGLDSDRVEVATRIMREHGFSEQLIAAARANEMYWADPILVNRGKKTFRVLKIGSPADERVIDRAVDICASYGGDIVGEFDVGQTMDFSVYDRAGHRERDHKIRVERIA